VIFDGADKSAQPRRGSGERIIQQRLLLARLSQTQPVVVQSDLIDRPAVLAEGMEVPVAELRPVAKFDADLNVAWSCG